MAVIVGRMDGEIANMGGLMCKLFQIRVNCLWYSYVIRA